MIVYLADDSIIVITFFVHFQSIFAPRIDSLFKNKNCFAAMQSFDSTSNNDLNIYSLNFATRIIQFVCLLFFYLFVLFHLVG